jgi:hypothetical protein
LPPPLPERIKFVPCEFDYLTKYDRQFVKDAYDVLSQRELWTRFRTELAEDGGREDIEFLFTPNPVYRTVRDAILHTNIGGLHSGSSLAYVMQTMRFIALYGEPAYRRQFQLSNTYLSS